MVPVLAPIREKTIRERTREHRLKLAGLALLAAGLAMAVALKGGLKPSAPPLSADLVGADVASVQSALVPPPAAPQRPNGGSPITFKEVADSQSAGNQQAPQACTNCWNKVHSGIDQGKEDSRDRLPTPSRPYTIDADRNLQFDLPYNPYGIPRMGGVPDSWQQCPQP